MHDSGIDRMSPDNDLNSGAGHSGSWWGLKMRFWSLYCAFLRARQGASRADTASRSGHLGQPADAEISIPLPMSWL